MSVVDSSPQSADSIQYRTYLLRISCSRTLKFWINLSVIAEKMLIIVWRYWVVYAIIYLVCLICFWGHHIFMRKMCFRYLGWRYGEGGEGLCITNSQNFPFFKLRMNAMPPEVRGVTTSKWRDWMGWMWGLDNSFLYLELQLQYNT